MHELQQDHWMNKNRNSSLRFFHSNRLNQHLSLDKSFLLLLLLLVLVVEQDTSQHN